MKQLLYLMLGLILFSCSKEEAEIENAKTPISFSSQVNIREKSRASDAGFETNDQIGVYITKWNSSTQTSLKSSGNYVDNKLYTYSSAGFNTSSLAYYPEDGSKIDVYAYYPYGELSSSTNVSFTVKPDQSTQAGYTNSDLMTSTVTGRSTSTAPIPLAFNHALAKIVIILDSKTVPAGTKSVTLENVYTSCNYNLSNGECSIKGSKSQIVLKADGANRFIGILPPQTFSAQQLLATITINGEPYTWTPKSDISFVSNIENEYTLIFENGDPVALSATIKPWGKPKDDELKLTIEASGYDVVKDLKNLAAENYFTGKLPDNIRLRMSSYLYKATTAFVGDESMVSKYDILLNNITQTATFTTKLDEAGYYQAITVCDLVEVNASGTIIKEYNKITAETSGPKVFINSSTKAGYLSAFGTAYSDFTIEGSRTINLSPKPAGGLITLHFTNIDSSVYPQMTYKFDGEYFSNYDAKIGGTNYTSSLTEYHTFNTEVQYTDYKLQLYAIPADPSSFTWGRTLMWNGKDFTVTPGVNNYIVADGNAHSTTIYNEIKK
ncbi:fimbrillin family protein [Bacteroides sp. 51]|uniref:fimbrillin family protein n=1 Tax=Bacteroides sp. 51 TaxID=2302938 RepID=UPI0013D7B0D9|nr:fimbrillin family protein [Bacteroides sp. 51]NDV80518.1 fimbrillin family protein [Bacteroides sp. 51]